MISCLITLISLTDVVEILSYKVSGFCVPEVLSC